MDGDVVSVTGARVGVLIYRLWLAAQVLVLALSIPAIVAAVGLNGDIWFLCQGCLSCTGSWRWRGPPDYGSWPT